MKSFVPIAMLVASAAAKTDLEGCTSFTSMVTVRPEPGYGNTYQTVIWYDPDSLEICAGVDCGGGRAPPKSVPGCPLYDGTETVTASFLSEDPLKPAKAATTATTTSTEAGEQTTAEAATTATEEASTSEDADTASESGETPSVATTSAPNTPSSAATTTPATPTGTSAVTTPATPEETTGSEDGEGDEQTGTDIPDAAAPTAVVALNIAAGLVAAVAFL